MAGKHSSGSHARKQEKGAGKTVMIVVIVVVVIAALAMGLIWFRTPQMPEEIPGEVAIAAATSSPDEFKVPKEEPVVQFPVEEPASEEAQKVFELEGQVALEEKQAPKEEPTDGESEMGPETPGGSTRLPPAKEEFASIFENAGIEPVYQLTDYEGVGYAVFARGDAEDGISQYEFLYKGDAVVTMAETYYDFFPGASQAELEENARGLAEAIQPPEGVECITTTCEAVEGGTILRILVEGLEDPAIVQQLSELALIPAYTDGGYLSFGSTGDNMGISGYVER